MSRPELGTKCTCVACHERFYDLNRSPAACPKCGAQQPPPIARAARRSRTTSGVGMHPRLAPAAATMADEAEEGATSAADAEDDDPDDDTPEPDEKADDGIEIDPDHVQTAD